MSAPARSRSLELIPGHERTAVIAHGGGNRPTRVEYAIAQGADWLEVDLWERAGHLEARHERRIGPLPILFESWYLRVAGPNFDLADMLRTIDGRARAFLDLKTGSAQTCDLIAQAVADAHPTVPPVASSQVWGALRRLRRASPEISVCYSIDVQAQLDLLFASAHRDDTPDGVSCRHTLLTDGVIERLHDLGIGIIAWTVDDLDRGAELARLGVKAITTHRIRDMRATLEQAL